MNFLEKLNSLRLKHPIIANLVYIIAVALLLLWGVLLFLDYWTMHGQTSVVPEIKHKY